MLSTSVTRVHQTNPYYVSRDTDHESPAHCHLARINTQDVPVLPRRQSLAIVISALHRSCIDLRIRP